MDTGARAKMDSPAFARALRPIEGIFCVGSSEFLGLAAIEIFGFPCCIIFGLSHNFQDWRRV